MKPLIDVSCTRPAPLSADRNATAVLDRGYLLETIVYDLHETAIQFGTLTGLVGEHVRRGGEGIPRQWRHLLLTDTVILLALRFSTDVGIPVALANDIQCVSVAIEDIKSKLKSLARRAGVADKELRSTLSRLAIQAQTTCGDLIDLLAAIDKSLQSRLAAPLMTDQRAILKFLSAVATNRARVVDGVLKAPQRTQRRRTPRAQVSVRCKVIIRGRVASAAICDVSREGLGVKCRKLLPVGETVVIHLDDGRQLSGTIINNRAQHAGIKLLKHLDLEDNLFRSVPKAQ